MKNVYLSQCSFCDQCIFSLWKLLSHSIIWLLMLLYLKMKKKS